MSFAWERLRQAVHTLAAPGSQRERLAQAFADCLAGLRPKDLPAEVRQEFAQLADALLLCRASRDAAMVRTRLDSIDDARIGGMIAAIIAMYDAVARYEPILRNLDEPPPKRKSLHP
jgi:hypothetical protein